MKARREEIKKAIKEIAVVTFASIIALVIAILCMTIVAKSVENIL